MDVIYPQETEIIGRWIAVDQSVKADDTCNRIKRLIANTLEHVAFDPKAGGWETLFRDRSDGRYWERTYPQSEMHGGGPPSLRCLPENVAVQKYNLSLQPNGHNGNRRQ